MPADVAASHLANGDRVASECAIRFRLSVFRATSFASHAHGQLEEFAWLENRKRRCFARGPKHNFDQSSRASHVAWRSLESMKNNVYLRRDKEDPIKNRSLKYRSPNPGFATPGNRSDERKGRGGSGNKKGFVIGDVRKAEHITNQADPSLPSRSEQQKFALSELILSDYASQDKSPAADRQEDSWKAVSGRHVLCITPCLPQRCDLRLSNCTNASMKE
uniref:Requiem_N domain-containing protein n=1 Tax=Steinernema glaseri TaxID=37863 RepID=A0A1I7Y3U5_9BILA